MDDALDSPLLDGLDPDQRRVALHDKGPLCVAASPGSGKTHTAVRRMGYLVNVRGVIPARILAVTFTRKARVEMESRLVALLGESRVPDVRTFHSLSRQILAAEMRDFDAWQPDKVMASDAYYKRWIKEAIGKKNENQAHGDKHLEWRAAEPTLLRTFVQLCKAEGAEPWSDRARELAERRFERLAHHPAADPALTNDAYHVAELKRIEARMMGFADWMVTALELLRMPETRDRWAAKHDYILVDESQDDSPLQSEMLVLLAQHTNIMAVGDCRQAIYAFAGASPELFRAFPVTHHATLAPLRYNYRSCDRVVQAGNLIADGLADQTLLEPMIASRGVEGVVSVTQYDSQEAEAEGVAIDIEERHAAGSSWGSHAILYRVRALSRACEDAFAKRGIPYHVVGGASFFEREDARILVAYLKLLAGKANVEDVCLTLRAPFRFLPRALFDALRATRWTEGMRWSTAVVEAAQKCPRAERVEQTAREWVALVRELAATLDKTSSIAETLQALVVRTRYMDWLKKEEGRETIENDRVSDVAEVVRASRAFQSIGEFLAHVDASIAAYDEAAGDEAEAEDRVLLLTMHACKGMEFEYVAAVSINDRVLPHVKAEDLEEERRLFYVAVTRAKDELHVSYVARAVSAGKERDLQASPFIEEIMSIVCERKVRHAA